MDDQGQQSVTRGEEADGAVPLPPGDSALPELLDLHLDRVAAGFNAP